MPLFEWDEAKRHATLAKHGIDFADLGPFFDQPLMVKAARSDEEARFLAVGPLKGIMIAVIYTLREDHLRIITARRARGNEREDFRTLLAGRTESDDGKD